VRATPRGGRDAIDGIEHRSDGNPVLKVRIRSAPVDGGANAALIRVIANAAGIAPSAVSLVRGTTARNKIFRLVGDPHALVNAFERVLAVAVDKTR
jgi:uncharacterized protein